MASLENLFLTAADSPAYETARRQKVAEIAAYLTGRLADGLDPQRMAEFVMNRAEDWGSIVGSVVKGEIPARYTRSGDPLPFAI